MTDLKTYLNLMGARLSLPVITQVQFQWVLRSVETPSKPAEKRTYPWDDAFASTVSTPDGGTIALDFQVEERGNGVILRPRLTSKGTNWTVEELRGPTLVFAPSDGFDLLLPDGLGSRHPRPHEMPLVDLPYPSGRCTMAWSALVGKGGGWYFGRHDRAFSTLHWTAEGKGGECVWGFRQFPWLKEGQTWESAPIHLLAFEGHWTNAAAIYRSWADEWFHRKNVPAWVADQTGWMLAILKQQNGEILYDYRNLSKVWRHAKDHGLTAVGLFGWAHGGHDRYYPDYHPDPAMGGEGELRRALADARKMGLKTVLYANGQLIDTSTDYYRWNGNAACSWKSNHEPYVSSIRKFDSSTPVTFALGCHGSKVWQEQITKLAKSAQALGADGILFDQVGVAGPMECHHPGHGHAHPRTGWAEERVAFYKDLCLEMRRMDPEFTVMTEGVFDALGPHLGWFHGWGTGFSPRNTYEFVGDGNTDFPAMFRSCFPEIPLMQRHSTPVLDVRTANHALMNGLQHEIEARWAPDVDYLDDGIQPAKDAYLDCTYYPPDDEMMRRVDTRAGRKILSDFCRFADENRDILRQGRPVGDEGLTDFGACRVMGFAGPGGYGLLAVNGGTGTQRILPKWHGKSPVSAAEPGTGSVPLTDGIPPGVARLYRF